MAKNQPKPVPPWWAGVKRATLYPVDFGSTTKGTLKVTDEGIVWSAGPIGTKHRFVPAAIQSIAVDTVERQHGRQRNALGFGAIGLAVVAETAIHNARARKIDELRQIVITDGAKKQWVYLTKKSTADVNAVIGSAAAVVHRVRTGAAAPLSPPAEPPAPDPAAVQRRLEEIRRTLEPAKPTAPLPIADELKKLAELRDAGILTEEEFATHKAKLLA